MLSVWVMYTWFSSSAKCAECILCSSCLNLYNSNLLLRLLKYLSSKRVLLDCLCFFLFASTHMYMFICKNLLHTTFIQLHYIRSDAAAFLFVSSFFLVLFPFPSAQISVLIVMSTIIRQTCIKPLQVGSLLSFEPRKE